MDPYPGWEDQLESYFTTEPGRSDVIDLLLNPDDSNYLPFNLNTCNLSNAAQDVWPSIIICPGRILPMCDKILVNATEKVYNSLEKALKARCKLKTKLRFRLICDVKEVKRTVVPKCQNVGTLVSFKGTVIKSTIPKIVEYGKRFRCKKCGHTFLMEADFGQYYRLEKPSVCKNDVGCSGFMFDLVKDDLNLEFCKDYQEIKVQEQVGNLNLGTIPRSIWVALEDDLINVCKPGDDVEVLGVVVRRWHPLGRSQDGRTDIGMAIKANYVNVNNDQNSANPLTNKERAEYERFWRRFRHDELRGRDEILASFCPQVSAKTNFLNCSLTDSKLLSFMCISLISLLGLWVVCN